MKRITLPARADWQDKARTVGFGFHTMYGEPYWTDDAAYVFTLEQIERDIEEPTRSLHQMCLDTLGRLIDSDEKLVRLQIPEAMIDLVRASWQAGEPTLYGRFDLAYDGAGPAKLLEYNADTPTSIFEAAFFQYNWMLDQIACGNLSDTVDQYNSLQEDLVAAFAQFAPDRLHHFSCVTESPEDTGTVAYLMDCARQAGHQVKLVDISQIGADPAGRFTDQDDITIDRCFKLYPWEHLLREPFAARLVPGVFIEPAWKAILSNKGFLPFLWEDHRDHPNLLEAYFDPGRIAGAHVVKPFFSREGSNITMIAADGTTGETTGGDYAEGPMIYQQTAHVFRHGTRHAVLGSWIIGDKPSGLGVREDEGLITKDMSRFVPHVIDG